MNIMYKDRDGARTCCTASSLRYVRNDYVSAVIMTGGMERMLLFRLVAGNADTRMKSAFEQGRISFMGDFLFADYTPGWEPEDNEGDIVAAIPNSRHFKQLPSGTYTDDY